jgi:hypothetical protein
VTGRDDLRAVADLLGLPRRMVRAVERRKNGDFAVSLSLRGVRWSEVPPGLRGRRVLRLPRRRVEGYRPRGPVRPRDARARAKQNAWRFALWLGWRVDLDAPVVRRAFVGDLGGVAALREAIQRAAPEPEPEPAGVVIFIGHNGDGRRAA